MGFKKKCKGTISKTSKWQRSSPLLGEGETGFSLEGPCSDSVYMVRHVSRAVKMVRKKKITIKSKWACYALPRFLMETVCSKDDISIETALPAPLITLNSGIDLS